MVTALSRTCCPPQERRTVRALRGVKCWMERGPHSRQWQRQRIKCGRGEWPMIACIPCVSEMVSKTNVEPFTRLWSS